jgi:hypothetical protein
MYLSFLQNSELTLLSQQESFSWTSLEYSLASYVNDPEQHGQAFDIDSIPVLSKDQELSMQLSMFVLYRIQGCRNGGGHRLGQECYSSTSSRDKGRYYRNLNASTSASKTRGTHEVLVG